MALSSLLGVLVSCAAVLISAAAPSAAVHTSDTPKPTIALLGVFFQNDNEGLEPTSAGENARLAAIGRQFQDKLKTEKRYEFMEVTPEIKSAIDAGQMLGECGGCEVAYGKQLGVDKIAWIRVQKVSNLILNMNVYVADVRSSKMDFMHSVDIRGNTDESWSRSLAYLMKNYMLAN